MVNVKRLFVIAAAVSACLCCTHWATPPPQTTIAQEPFPSCVFPPPDEILGASLYVCPVVGDDAVCCVYGYKAELSTGEEYKIRFAVCASDCDGGLTIISIDLLSVWDT